MNAWTKTNNDSARRNCITLLLCAGVDAKTALGNLAHKGTLLEDGMYQFEYRLSDSTACQVAFTISAGKWYLDEISARVDGTPMLLPAALAALRELLGQAKRLKIETILTQPMDESDLQRIRESWAMSNRAVLKDVLGDSLEANNEQKD